jgi:hypothetical protein
LTYKRPVSLEEVKACVQRKGETLRSYIQRWSVIKNSVEDVSDERVLLGDGARKEAAGVEQYVLVRGD